MQEFLDAIVEFFTELYEDFWVDLREWVWGFVNDLLAWFIDQFWIFVDWIEAHAKGMGIDVREYAEQIGPAVGTLLNIFADFAWILPLYELVGVYTSAYAVKLLLRSVRHIIGWVPTIEG